MYNTKVHQRSDNLQKGGEQKGKKKKKKEKRKEEKPHAHLAIAK